MLWTHFIFFILFLTTDTLSCYDRNDFVEQYTGFSCEDMYDKMFVQFVTMNTRSDPCESAPLLNQHCCATCQRKKTDCVNHDSLMQTWMTETLSSIGLQSGSNDSATCASTWNALRQQTADGNFTNPCNQDAGRNVAFKTLCCDLCEEKADCENDDDEATLVFKKKFDLQTWDGTCESALNTPFMTCETSISEFTSKGYESFGQMCPILCDRCDTRTPTELPSFSPSLAPTSTCHVLDLRCTTTFDGVYHLDLTTMSSNPVWRDSLGRILYRSVFGVLGEKARWVFSDVVNDLLLISHSQASQFPDGSQEWFHTTSGLNFKQNYTCVDKIFCIDSPLPSPAPITSTPSNSPIEATNQPTRATSEPTTTLNPTQSTTEPTIPSVETTDSAPRVPTIELDIIFVNSFSEVADSLDVFLTLCTRVLSDAELAGKCKAARGSSSDNRLIVEVESLTRTVINEIEHYLNEKGLYLLPSFPHLKTVKSQLGETTTESQETATTKNVIGSPQMAAVENSGPTFLGMPVDSPAIIGIFLGIGVGLLCLVFVIYYFCRSCHRGKRFVDNYESKSNYKDLNETPDSFFPPAPRNNAKRRTSEKVSQRKPGYEEQMEYYGTSMYNLSANEAAEESSTEESLHWNGNRGEKQAAIQENINVYGELKPTYLGRSPPDQRSQIKAKNTFAQRKHGFSLDDESSEYINTEMTMGTYQDHMIPVNTFFVNPQFAENELASTFVEESTELYGSPAREGFSESLSSYPDSEGVLSTSQGYHLQKSLQTRKQTLDEPSPPSNAEIAANSGSKRTTNNSLQQIAINNSMGKRMILNPKDPRYADDANDLTEEIRNSPGSVSERELLDTEQFSSGDEIAWPLSSPVSKRLASSTPSSLSSVHNYHLE